MIPLLGGGGENIRLLEIKHFNLSIPLCQDSTQIAKYLTRHDVLFPFKFIYNRLRYKAIRLIRRRASYRPFYEFYAHIVWGEEGVVNDRIMKHYRESSFKPYAFPYGINMSFVYSNDVYALLKDDFRLKIPLRYDNAMLKKQIQNTDKSVFLHIRRGDYLQSEGLYVVLGVTYYQKALEILKSKITNPHIFVFSNDMCWCKEYLMRYVDFSGCTIDFIEGNTEGNAVEEMELMRSCQHAIIANSTFSWWAAYLIENPDKIVIMPKEYLNDSSRFLPKQFLALKNWFLVDHIWGSVELAN